MNSFKPPLLLLCALAAVGSGVLAWQQHREVVRLRARLALSTDGVELQKRLAEAEQHARDLEGQLALAQSDTDVPAEAAMAPVAAKEDSSEAERPNRGDRGPGGNRGGGQFGPGMRAILDNPEAQQLMAVQQRASLDARFAALFKNLNLPPEQLEKLKELLVDRQNAMLDVMVAAREQGLTPRNNPEAFQKLVASTQAEIDNSIRATLGEDGFAQYQQYEKTIPQRNLVNQLQQRLSYTGAPLSDTQTEQLVQVLASTSTQRNANTNDGGAGGGRGGFAGFAGGTGATRITKDAIVASQTVLSAPQVDALKQLQQAQQAQQQLQRLIRETQRTNAATGENARPRRTPGG